jgi:hypothetical protein
MKVNLRKMQPPVHPVERAKPSYVCVHQLELLHSLSSVDHHIRLLL